MDAAARPGASACASAGRPTTVSGVLQAVAHRRRILAGMLGLGFVSIVVLAQRQVAGAAAIIDLIRDRVIVLRFIRQARHRAEVSDREVPIGLDFDDLALVLVRPALVLARPGDRAAGLPSLLPPVTLDLDM